MSLTGRFASPAVVSLYERLQLGVVCERLRGWAARGRALDPEGVGVIHSRVRDQAVPGAEDCAQLARARRAVVDGPADAAFLAEGLKDGHDDPQRDAVGSRRCDPLV